MRNVGLCLRNEPGLYRMGWMQQTQRWYQFLLEPRIIAFSREACSGREKPFLFRPQRVAWGSRPFSLPHKQARRLSPWQAERSEEVGCLNWVPIMSWIV